MFYILDEIFPILYCGPRPPPNLTALFFLVERRLMDCGWTPGQEEGQKP